MPKIDFSKVDDVQDFSPLPDGKYLCKVSEIEEAGDLIEVYVQADKLSQIKKDLEKEDFSISSFELVQKAKTLKTLSDAKLAQKALDFLENLEAHEDIQKVFTNLDINEETMSKIS